MRSYKSRKTNLFFISAIVILLIFFIFPRKKGNILFKSIHFVVGSLQTASVNLRSSIYDTVGKYLFLLNLRKENHQLKAENLNLKTENQALKGLQYENNQLRKLIGFSLKEESKLLPARIIATDLLSQNHLLTINKGSHHGIKKFMGVLHPEGVVGYVFHVTPYSAQIVTLFNELSTLPAKNQRTGVKGLIENEGTHLIFKYFNMNQQNESDFRKGDMIVTLKQESFPSKFHLGTVEKIKEEKKSGNRIIFIQPSAPFSSLEHVFVILKPLSEKDK